MRVLLSCSFIILRYVDLEYVSPSVRWNLGMLVNTLTADGKHPVECCGNLHLPIQMQLSAKKKIFLNFLFHFWNLHESLNILKLNRMLIANVLPNLKIVNILISTLSKKHRCRTRFDIQHMKASQILAKFLWDRFYHVLHHSEGSWFGKCVP